MQKRNSYNPYFDDNVILNKPQAARFLQIRPRTLDLWMKRGRVPFIKLPSGAVRFRRDQLLDFISQFHARHSA
jgi:predicted site-specific integrase-resolvase